MEEYREFEFCRGKLRFVQPKHHRLSIIEILFVANLLGIKRKHKIADLGAGFGTLSIFTTLLYGCKVWAVERDKTMLELLRHNIKLNNLEDMVKVVEGDVRQIEQVMDRGVFDGVIINPPFYPKGAYVSNPYHHEKDTSLRDFIKAGSYLLKDGRGINLLISSDRVFEAFYLLEKENTGVKSVRFFYPKLDKNSKVVRIYGVKNSKPSPLIEKPLIINEGDGKYTKEVLYCLDKICGIINKV
ncbi:MAG: methyltransferase domain-containing protein [Aquificota bacterium]|nr:MAG: methyltransferase domain-containing protein [Aquificota bacterium]